MSHFLHLREGIPRCFQQNCLRIQVVRNLFFKLAIFDFQLHSLFSCPFTLRRGVLITIRREIIYCHQWRQIRRQCIVTIYDVKCLGKHHWRQIYIWRQWVDGHWATSNTALTLSFVVAFAFAFAITVTVAVVVAAAFAATKFKKTFFHVSLRSRSRRPKAWVFLS